MFSPPSEECATRTIGDPPMKAICEKSFTESNVGEGLMAGATTCEGIPEIRKV